MLFRQLESFNAVVDKGSISAAAAALGLSQPAVSKHISTLEKELGTVLFKRGHKCSFLTREGRIVHRHTKKIIDEMKEIVLEVANASSQVSGTVRVSASSIPGDFVLPGVFVEFAARYPSVDVNVNISDSRLAYEALIAHETDIAVIGEERHPAGCVVHPFFKDEIILIAGEGHHLASYDKISAKMVSGLLLAGRTMGSGTAGALSRYLQKQGISFAGPQLKFGHAMAVIKAVESGVVAGFVSDRAVAGGNSSLVRISLDPPLERTFFLIHEKLLTKASRALVDFLLNRKRENQNFLF